MTEEFPKTRLQAERLKRQWTQAEVARRIKGEVKTISRWERGEQVAGPLKRRRLSALFGETVDVSWFRRLETKEDSPSPLWNVPFERNPYFTDDENRVQHLHALLTSEETEVSHVAISGLGGIGKTQLALEYAHEYRDSYEAILWVRAGTPAQLLEDYARIAYLLQVPEAKKREPKQQYLVNEVLHWLRTHSGWLLVLDNVEEDLNEERPDTKESAGQRDTVPVEGDLKTARLLSTLRGGHILLTTRAQSTANLAQNFLLDAMSVEEGAQFLLRRAHLLPSSATLQAIGHTRREDACALSRLLGGLPLALEQAAAYIQETGCGLAGYRQVYEASRKEVLQSKVKYKRLYTDYSESVATTWLISFRRVEYQSVVASDLLKLYAYLAPDSIPENIVLKGAEKLDANLRQLAGSTYQFDSACQVLLNYSLVKRFAEGMMLSIHRLVQAVLQDTMDDEAQHHFWAEQAVRAVEHAFFSATNQEVEQYLPHAQMCATYIERYHLEGQEVAYLLKMAAKAVDERGWYAQAQPLYMQAFNAYTHSFGPDDTRTLHLLFDVLHIHMDMGASPFAAKVYTQIIADFQRVLGPDHPDLLVLLTNVTWARLLAGDYEGAVQTGMQALELLDRLPNTDAIERAKTYQVVAEVAVLLGRADLAEAYYQEARMLFEQRLGPEHPEVANTLANSGAFYAIRGKLAQGERLLRQALEIRQRVLGPDHPETADSLVALAAIVWQTSRYSEAETYYHQALTIRQQKLGPDHADVLQTLRSLAQLAAVQKKDEEAEHYFREAFALAPQVSATAPYECELLLKAYADYLRERGRIDEADKIQQDER